jgi:hypothetical protein
MKLFRSAALMAALMLAACAPKAVKVVQPIPASVRGASMVSDVDVRLSPLAQDIMNKFEAKAAEKRAEANLPPVAAGAPLAGKPSRDEYATLPFAQMFELVVMDVTRERGLGTGRPLRLDVEIDTLKTANAAMALVAGSNDQLAGSVKVLDASSGEGLGEFYVDVINSHSGLLGLAMRGGGVRESLAEEFALHISRQLGGKNKGKK